MAIHTLLPVDVSARIVPERRTAKRAARAELVVSVSDGAFVADASVPLPASPDVILMERALRAVHGPIREVLRLTSGDSTHADSLLRDIDGTGSFRRIGREAAYAVSLAYRKLSARREGKPLWKIVAREANTIPAIPLHLVSLYQSSHTPQEEPFAGYGVLIGGSPRRRAETAAAIYARFWRIVKRTHGHESGYVHPGRSADSVLELVRRGIGDVRDVSIVVDVGADHFYGRGKYRRGGEFLDRGEMIDLYGALTRRFDISCFIRPFAMDDIESFHALVARLPKEVAVESPLYGVLSGPDLVRRLVFTQAGNMLRISPNDYATLSDMYASASLARSAGWRVVFDGSVGSLSDSSSADIAAGLGADILDLGIPGTLPGRMVSGRLATLERELSREGR